MTDRRSLVLVLCTLVISSFFCACGIIREKVEPADSMTGVDVKELTKKPLTPEQSDKLLNEVGSNWLYGQGVGETAVIVGTSIVFPPYALWVLGNAALDVSGYEPLRVSDALPEEEGEAWRNTYDSITSGPGRLSASLAGEEFRTREVAKERIEQVLVDGGKEKDSPGKANQVGASPSNGVAK